MAAWPERCFCLIVGNPSQKPGFNYLFILGAHINILYIGLMGLVSSQARDDVWRPGVANMGKLFLPQILDFVFCVDINVKH